MMTKQVPVLAICLLCLALLGGCTGQETSASISSLPARESQSVSGVPQGRVPYDGTFDVWANADTFGYVLTVGGTDSFTINPAVISGGEGGAGTAEVMDGNTATITYTAETQFLLCVSIQSEDGTSIETLYQASIQDIQPGGGVSVWGRANGDTWAADTIVVMELILQF